MATAAETKPRKKAAPKAATTQTPLGRCGIRLFRDASLKCAGDLMGISARRFRFAELVCALNEIP